MRKNKFVKVEECTNKIAEKMFLNGISITKIAKELNIDRGCLSTRLKKKGLNVVQHCNKKGIDSKYFDLINTENKAYWLGFLIADGSISDDNKVELSSKDLEHIEKFKSDIKAEQKISTKYVLLNGKTFISYRISFSDQNLGLMLKKLECVPRKSLNCKMPNLDKQLMRHFVRGYFDGNGSICLGLTRNKTQISFSSGCKGFLDKISEFLNKQLSLSPGLYTRTCQTSYEVRPYNNKNKTKLLDYMYKDSNIYLDRKYKLYTSLPS